MRLLFLPHHSKTIPRNFVGVHAISKRVQALLVERCALLDVKEGLLRWYLRGWRYQVVILTRIHSGRSFFLCGRALRFFFRWLLDNPVTVHRFLGDRPFLRSGARRVAANDGLLLSCT
eukprot:scaffold2555_cov469-Pavlova_lutheri.AAC.1